MGLMNGMRSSNENGVASVGGEGGRGGLLFTSNEDAGGSNVLSVSCLADSGAVMDAQLVKKASNRTGRIVVLQATVIRDVILLLSNKAAYTGN